MTSAALLVLQDGIPVQFGVMALPPEHENVVFSGRRPMGFSYLPYSEGLARYRTRYFQQHTFEEEIAYSYQLLKGPGWVDEKIAEYRRRCVGNLICHSDQIVYRDQERMATKVKIFGYSYIVSDLLELHALLRHPLVTTSFR